MIELIEGITTERLYELYSDPYITKIGHDHRPAYPVFDQTATYLSAFVDGKFAGAFLAIKSSFIEYDLHALLKKSHIKQSRDLGRAFLLWAFAHPIERVTAYIIEGLGSAANYCRKLGFVDEGVRRNACIQNGIKKNVYILGMTREDWEVLA